MDIEIQKALANEARRNELNQKIAQLSGAMNATASLVQNLTSINSDSAIMLENAKGELATLNQGAGPGVTADFGRKSSVTQMIESERFAAKDAAIKFIKDNPTCSEEGAAAVWNAAALASHPDFTQVVQDGMVMSALYRANLFAAKLIPENTWEEHRLFVLNNDISFVESL